MEFKQTTIAPAGRNKYGNYLSSGNVTKSVVMTTYAGNDTTTTIADTGGNKEDLPVYFYCMLSSPNFTFNAVDIANTITAETLVIAYKGYDKAYTYVCDMESVTAVIDEDDNTIVSLTAPTNQGVIGVPAGMSVSFNNNGTSATSIVFSVTSSLVGDSGSVFIPVQVYKRDDDIPEPNDLYSWYEHTYNILSGAPVPTNNCEQVWLEYTWYANRASGGSGSTGPSGESAWYLTLSNDNASVNCDANGNVLSGATKPSCQAKLYYGSTRKSDATFNVDYGSASGVSTGVSNGILTISAGTNFNFTGTTLVISVSGISSGQVRDVKTMNITKSYPGDNGEPSVSYWLETNYSNVIYDPNTHTPNPPAITVTGYRQVGQGPVEEATAATFQYMYQYRSTGSFTPASAYSSAIAITSAKCETYSRLRFVMYNGAAQVDQEDVDILKDGENGVPGEGRQGAAIRGPYDYAEVSASTRCWCAGSSGTGCDDCDKWIDVVMCGDTYYYCNTSYYGALSSHFPGYWTSGDSFDFVATKVLLAENAKIDFLTNNWLYLRDENGNIVGGARGSSAGTIFWAGSEDPDNGDTPFRVDLEGNIYAQKGVFAGYIQYPYTLIGGPSGLTHSTSGTGGNEVSMYEADGRAYLVSDAQSTIGSTSYHNEPAYLFLPTPSSAWNGFTYDIIVDPAGARGNTAQQLFIMTRPLTDIYCYAYTDPRRAQVFLLTGGRYQITCIPKYENNAYQFRWVITLATAGIDMYSNYGTANLSVEYLSTMVGTSLDTNNMVNNIVTYTGTKPNNTGSTMYVKL